MANYPAYYNPYQSIYQPYQPMQYQQFPQIQQAPQPVQQPRQIIGRMVATPSDITVQEVPQDGSIALFMKSDGSEIYGKQWAANGTITTVTFKPVTDETIDEKSNTDAFSGISDAIQAGFADMAARLDKLEKIVRPAPRKKEVDTDV